MMLRHTLRLLFLLLLTALTAKAQVVHVTGTVTRDMRGVDGQHQRVALSIPVYIFDHVDEARQ